MYFFTLSQAAPALECEIAIEEPDIKAPNNKPETAKGPNRTPILLKY